ncbi:MAG: T9SS type A sorting domain-containing protein [Saprospiraceae bacterium]
MKLRLFVPLFVIFGITWSNAQAQLREKHHEVMDNSYVPVDKSLMPRQNPYQERRSTVITTQVNVDSNGEDIIGDAGNEPSIAVDPTNPNRIVIGWRQFDTVTNNFRQGGYGYSLDGGMTFVFPGVLEPGIFRSDPVLDFDAEGNFYYNSLTQGFACDVWQITDGGVDWTGPYPAHGGDKQWMRLDRTGGIGDKHNYSFWTSSFSTCDPGFFTRSTDGSMTFEDCEIIDNDPFWGTLAVDKDGNLYLTGASFGSIVLVKSTTAKDPLQEVSWDFVTTVDLGGVLDAGFVLNPQGLIGQAWVATGDSGNPGPENVYVCASVVPTNDPSDVMFARSTDGGLTFDPPVRINTDAVGHHNWFGTMSVAPNGRIDVVWLDTRDDPNNILSRLYYSFSEDQGTTWSPNEPLSPAFDSRVGWPQQNKMGDYFDMVSDDNYAHLAWANTLNGGQDVYYTRIDPEAIILNQANFQTSLFEGKAYPNPFSDGVQIAFNVPEKQHIKVTLYDILGREVTTLLDAEVDGLQQLSYTAPSTVKAGNYFVIVQGAQGKQALRITKR